MRRQTHQPMQSQHQEEVEQPPLQI
jgi:hypothetical protein